MSKIGTYHEWQSTNPILAPLETGYEDHGNSAYKIKIGDGATRWNNLPYKYDFEMNVKEIQNADNVTFFLFKRGDLTSL